MRVQSWKAMFTFGQSKPGPASRLRQSRHAGLIFAFVSSTLRSGIVGKVRAKFIGTCWSGLRECNGWQRKRGHEFTVISQIPCPSPNRLCLRGLQPQAKKFTVLFAVIFAVIARIREKAVNFP